MTKTNSLAKNSLYYLISNVFNMLFPFLVAVYAAWVLSPAVIGEVAAAQNLVTYFVIISYLGIPTYGLREISKNRNDKDKLSKLTSELFTINLISTIVFTILYGILIFSVPSYRANLPLFLVVGLSLVLNSIQVAWLYEGLEKFKYVSIKNIIVRLFCFLILVLCVKDDSNYLVYASMIALGYAGNYIIDIFCLRKYVHISFKNLDLKQHMKPILFLVVVNLSIEIYTLVDITMLNIFTDSETVAFYSYGSKIQKILLQVINTFTMVLVPRISIYYKENKMDDYNKLISYCFKIIVFFAVPMIIGIIFVSEFLITSIYGDVYIQSSRILNVLSLIILISPIGYLLGSRVLLVNGKESKMVIAVGSGAVANVILNYVLIHYYKDVGAAMASVISELIIMFIYILLGRKYFKLIGVKKTVFDTILSSIIMFTYLILIHLYIGNIYLKFTLELIGAVIIYIIVNLILKEDLILDIIHKRFLK